MTIIKKPVPNFYLRDGFKPNLIVIHTGDGNRNAIWQTVANPNNPKSYNYLILTDGMIWEFVPEEYAAWANGLKINPTATLIQSLPDVNPNKVSISIAFEGHNAQYDANLLQYESCQNLVKDICQRRKIIVDRMHIIGHREINANKICPGLISIDQIIYQTNRAIEFETRGLEVKLSLLQRILEYLKQLLNLQLKLNKLGSACLLDDKNQVGS